MKIYISHASAYDYERELYEPIRGSELYKQHTFFLPHESHNTGVPAKQVLADTDLLVAEVSLPSTGQGIELGLASAAGVPIICFYKAGAKYSGSVRFISKDVIPYNNPTDLLERMASFLGVKQ